VLQPWLPDHTPALISRSPKDSSGLLCFIVRFST
jgi:hypothetical protein